MGGDPAVAEVFPKSFQNLLIHRIFSHHAAPHHCGTPFLVSIPREECRLLLTKPGKTVGEKDIFVSSGEIPQTVALHILYQLADGTVMAAHAHQYDHNRRQKIKHNSNDGKLLYPKIVGIIIPKRGGNDIIPVSGTGIDAGNHIGVISIRLFHHHRLLRPQLLFPALLPAWATSQPHS